MHPTFLGLAVLASFGVIGTTLLVTDRDHQEDAVSYPTPDEHTAYSALEVAAVSLKPFCLTLDRPPKRIWSECYRAGSIQRAIPANASPGASGEGLSLTLSSPVHGDPERLPVLVRLVIGEVPIPAVPPAVGGLP